MPCERDGAAGAVAMIDRAWRGIVLVTLLAVPPAAGQLPDPATTDPTNPQPPAATSPEPAPEALADIAIYQIGLIPEEPDDEHAFQICVELQNYGTADPVPFNAALVLDGEEVASKRYSQFPEHGDQWCEFVRAELGWHRFEAVADYDEEVPEASEDNNRRHVNFLVREPARPDLSLSIFTNPDPPVRGQTIAFTARVKNVGAASSNASRVHFLYDGTLVANRAVPRLPPGYTHLVAATLDADRLREGDHVVRVIADAESNVTELNEENNEATREFNLPRVPRVDLAVLNFTVSGLRDTHVGNFSAEIGNVGDVDAASFVVRFVLDNKSTLAAPRVANLKAGNRTTVAASWMARSPGPHALSVVVDGAKEVEDPVRENNEVHRAVTIRPPTDEPPAPDLLVERILFLPSNPQPGKAVNVTAVVKNDGRVRSPAFNVTFYVDHEIVSASRFANLAPGGLVASIATWKGPAGSHAVHVVVDPDDAVAERDEANNEKEASLRILDAAPPPATAAPTPLPSSNATGSAAPGSGSGERAAAEPSTLEIEEVLAVLDNKDANGDPDPRYAVQVFNRGTTPVPGFQIQFLVDGTLVGTKTRGGIQPGGEVSVSFGKRDDPTFALPPPGEHVLRALVLKPGSTDVADAKEKRFLVEAPAEENAAPAAPAAVGLALAAIGALVRRPKRR